MAMVSGLMSMMILHIILIPVVILIREKNSAFGHA